MSSIEPWFPSARIVDHHQCIPQYNRTSRRLIERQPIPKRI
nr:MAG TPA: alpha-amylase inhibitor [Caudoviricetes sp.]